MCGAEDRSNLLNAGAIATAVGGVEGVAGTILATIEAVDPALDVPAEAAAGVVTLIGSMVTKALGALQTASGEPVTVETLTALLPEATPLPEPS